jgi:hypothetical protein
MEQGGGTKSEKAEKSRGGRFEIEQNDRMVFE